MDFSTLPKIELHLHLDCSLSYDAVSRLAPGVTQEEYAHHWVAPARCTNLADFLSRVPKVLRLLQDRASLELITRDLLQQLRADGVIYAEIRFAPLLHLEGGLSPERVVEIVNDATGRGSAETGVEARLILCTLRHFSAEQSLATAQLVQLFQGSRVVALDLAGDEAGFPLDAHEPAYRYARERGLPHIAHAGEALGPESVWETLQRLQPARIGHGTRSIEDPALVRYLSEHRIHLELCPSSNVQIIPSIENWANHPIDRLYRAGVPLNANTDTRMLTPATLSSEYARLAQVFGWTEREFRATNRMAVDAAFCDEATKARLRVRFEE